MFSFKRKRKTGYGEEEDGGVNWPLVGLTLIVGAVACGLLYLLLAPVLLDGDDEPEIVIVPYGEDGSPTPSAPSLTPPPAPTEVTLPSPAPTEAGVLLPITAASVRQVEPIAALVGHSNAVSSVAFSPDGRTLASGDRDGMVRLWNAAQGVEILTFRSDSNWVTSISFNPDGSQLAAGGQDELVRRWDLATGDSLAPLAGAGGPVNSVAFSPDGSLLAAGSDDGTVYLWDLDDPGATPATLAGHTSFVTAVAFSPDGSLLAAGGQDNTVRVWEVASGAARSVLDGHTGNISSIAFSPDGQTLASTGADHAVRLWDLGELAPTESERAFLVGHTENVNDVVFSPDGSLIVSAAGGIEDNTVRLWDAASGQELRAIYPAGPANALAFSPDGRRLAVGGATYLSLWGAVEGAATPAGPVPTATVALEYDTPDAPVLAPGEEAASGACVLIIGTDGVTLREGPGAAYAETGALTSGQQVAAVAWTRGTEEGFTWWRLENGSWLRGDQLSNVNTLPDPCWALPLVTDPDAPLPTTVPGATAPESPAAPAGTLAPVATPDATGAAGCLLTALADEVNVRAGPGITNEIVANLSQGQPVQATGWTQDAEQYVWWRLAAGQWVRADTVEFPDACLTLPRVTP